MNIFLWIFQVVLAVFCFAGGSFKVFKYEQLAQVPAAAVLPQWGWTTLGVFEMLCGVLLIVPAAMKWMPMLTPTAAVALAVESMILAILFARHSLQLTAENPLVWVVAMALMAAFVAYGRYAIRSPA
jgi:hypothetical protein